MAGHSLQVRPVPQWVRLLGVLVIDLLLILAVVGGGLLEHGTSPIDRPEYLLRTALPFIVGWWLSASILGLYSNGMTAALPQTMSRIAIAWGGATLLGSLIRLSDFVLGSASPDFVAIMFMIGFLALGPWRLAVAFFNDRSSPGITD